MKGDELHAAKLINTITGFVSLVSMVDLPAVEIALQHLRDELNSGLRVALPMGGDSDGRAREVLHMACGYLRVRRDELRRERDERERLAREDIALHDPA